MIDTVIRRQAQHLEEIYTVLRKNDIKLSKSKSIKIVGARNLFEMLVATKKIRMIKRNDSQCDLWKCNAEDVFRYANYRERIK